MEANCLWDFLYEIQSFPEFAELRHQLFGITETENIHGTILLPISDMKEKIDEHGHVQQEVKPMVDLSGHTVEKHHGVKLVTENVRTKLVGPVKEIGSIQNSLQLSGTEKEKNI